MSTTNMNLKDIVKVMSKNKRYTDVSVLLISGGNRSNLPPQATASDSSYRLQPLEGFLKLYKLF